MFAPIDGVIVEPAGRGARKLQQALQGNQTWQQDWGAYIVQGYHTFEDLKRLAATTDRTLDTLSSCAKVEIKGLVPNDAGSM